MIPGAERPITGNRAEEVTTTRTRRRNRVPRLHPETVQSWLQFPPSSGTPCRASTGRRQVGPHRHGLRPSQPQPVQALLGAILHTQRPPRPSVPTSAEGMPRHAVFRGFEGQISSRTGGGVRRRAGAHVLPPEPGICKPACCRTLEFVRNPALDISRLGMSPATLRAQRGTEGLHEGPRQAP